MKRALCVAILLASVAGCGGFEELREQAARSRREHPEKWDLTKPEGQANPLLPGSTANLILLTQ